MSRRTLVYGFAFLILLALGGVAAMFWNRGKKEPVRIYPALASLIPGDAKIVAGIQLERVKTMPIYKKLVLDRLNPAIDRFAKETSFDPRENLYELVFVSNGKDTVVLASGKFAKTGELRGGMDPGPSLGGIRTSYKGYALEEKGNSSLCFINTATAVAGTPDSIRRFIDSRERNPAPPAELLKLVEQIPMRYQMWAISTADIDQVLPEIPLGEFGKLKSMPVKLSRVTAVADVSLGFQMRIDADAPDVKSAEQIYGALKGLLGVARLASPEGEVDVLTALDGVTVTQLPQAVRVEGDLPLELLERLLERLEGSGLPRPANAARKAPQDADQAWAQRN
jgi:hypothetical protein